MYRDPYRKGDLASRSIKPRMAGVVASNAATPDDSEIVTVSDLLVPAKSHPMS